MRANLGAWLEDTLLRRVLRNTGYLFSSATIAMALTSAQGILAALLLGPGEYGALGIVVLFTSSVNRLLSFRMGEMVIKYGGQSLALGKKEQAGAVIKIAGIAEALTSLVAFALLLALAPWAARFFIKDASYAPWISLFGATILVNLITETSTAVLQIGNHYRSQALLNLAQSLVTAGFITAAFFLKGGLREVLIAYIAGKAIFGIGIAVFALRCMPDLVGRNWLRIPLSGLPNRAEIARFAISTNLSGTINMVIRDSEVLWVGFFFTKVEAGYYKFALAVMNILLAPVIPLINTTSPEINNLVALRAWPDLRNLLKRTSLLAAAWTGACITGVLLVGNWFLTILKNGAFQPSFAAILILLLGYGFANILFWNRPLLLALGNPNYPLVVMLVVGLVKIGLMLAFVRSWGFLGQAGLLTGYFVFSVGWIVLGGLAFLRRQEQQPSPAVQP